MKVSYSLNGQPLDSERMRVLVGTTHYTALSPIVDTVQVPGRHGVIHSGVGCSGADSQGRGVGC